MLFDNEFLDRQMSQHAMMMQLNEVGPIALAQPNRTFDLFMRMVNITRGFCPNDYISSSWVNHVSELFYILHKGREFQYDEVLSEEDYVWIREILHKCESKEYRLQLTNDIGNGTNCPSDHIGGRVRTRQI